MIVKHCTFKSVVYFGSGWLGLWQLNLTAFVYSQSSDWIGRLEDVRSAALVFSTRTNAQSWIRNQTVRKYMQSREHLFNVSSPTRVQWKAFISSVLSGVSRIYHIHALSSALRTLKCGSYCRRCGRCVVCQELWKRERRRAVLWFVVGPTTQGGAAVLFYFFV